MHPCRLDALGGVCLVLPQGAHPHQAPQAIPPNPRDPAQVAQGLLPQGELPLHFGPLLAVPGHLWVAALLLQA